MYNNVIKEQRLVLMDKKITNHLHIFDAGLNVSILCLHLVILLLCVGR